MGQQQLLLVILVTIIVGIATVVAINTFGSAAESANVDAVRQDVASIAASAQGYFMKPNMLGGGGQDFTNITFEDMAFSANGISSNGLIAQNENGRYEITSRATDNFVVEAHPSSDETYVAGTVDGSGVLSGGTAATNTLEYTIYRDDMQETGS